MKPHPVTAPRLTESELDEIRTLIEHRSAILFDSSRERFFSTRVREYLEEKGLSGGADLLRHVRASSVEYESLLERLLTQETSFFRYPAVYQALEKKILPEVQERKFWENPRTLRIWSAGCSTGEEPYSIAITVCEALKFAEAWEIEILSTDISRRALRHAERGVYSKRTLQNVSLGQAESFRRAPSRHPASLL
jgi:chemotaxis protein methyltransferase CheR